MEHRRSGVRGSVIIQVAITMAVLLGFAALTVDYGLLVVTQRQLQNATDAAALAAGPELVHPEITLNHAWVARTTAEKYASFNKAHSAAALVTGHQIEVAAWQDVETPFIRVLDPSRRVSRVRARSVVEAFPVQQAYRLRPWGVPIGFFNPNGASRYRLGDPAHLVLVEGIQEQPANEAQTITYAAPLALGGSDPKFSQYPTYAENIRMGYNDAVSVAFRGRGNVNTQPTSSIDELRRVTQSAVDSLLQRARDSQYKDDTWERYQPDNPRIVFLPVLDRPLGGGVDGANKSNILGFAAFYLEEMDNGVIQGRFIPYTLPWDGKKPGTILPEAYSFGMYSFRLTQ